MRNVCLLAKWELDALAEGVQPNCRAHRHCRKDEARQMCGFGDEQPFHQPIAQYVDERRIVAITRYEWRKKPSGPVSVMQLVEV